MLADDDAAARPREGGPYRLVRPLLFSLDAERAHELGLAGLRAMQALAPLRRRVARRCRPCDERLRQGLLGLEFPAPLGLAAGFDKNGVAIEALEALGFGFLEVGTVTPRPQAGNPRPRMFRHPAQRSLQNALGFNNRGQEALAARLKKSPLRGVPVGVNVGRNRDTPAEQTAEDYRRLVAGLDGLCDYFVVNVSSPNTPGLRDLERPERLAELLETVRGATALPYLVKLSPDQDPAAAVELARAACAAGASGVVLANTTIDYSLVAGAGPPGGLSGAVLCERSFALLRAVARELFGRCLLVSVGGVETAAEAYRRLRHGASLVQLYTGLVYSGPGLASRIHRGLVELLERDGAASVAEIVGADLD